jgi:hypothetical protein
MQNSNMTTHSFRAECQSDMNTFCDLIEGTEGHISVQGLECELYTQFQTKELVEIMMLVEDGHVMIETLRPVPLSKNSLNRNYGGVGVDA